jgi:hypothetical protein
MHLSMLMGVGSHGSFYLLLMMKVTILHFVNDTHIVNTALNGFVLPPKKPSFSATSSSLCYLQSGVVKFLSAIS